MEEKERGRKEETLGLTDCFTVEANSVPFKAALNKCHYVSESTDF